MKKSTYSQKLFILMPYTWQTVASVEAIFKFYPATKASAVTVVVVVACEQIHLHWRTPEVRLYLKISDFWG